MDALHAFAYAPFLGQAVWLWLIFGGIVITLLVFDLGVLHKDDHEIGVQESLLLYAGEISVALIFSYFAIPRKYQHRVLFWGILGVIVLRAIMIGLGAALVSQFSWVLYLFGAFLVLTGIKMWIIADHMPDIANNPLLKFLRKHLRVTEQVEGNAFVVKRIDAATGKLQHWATPLFLALCLVEFVDLVFAIDSVPAIFAITTDPFIVYTSNIYAILGLRALYFALAAMVHRFKYLKYALALVLVFIGTKIFLVGIIGKIPPVFSLSITFGLIAGGVIVSLWKTRNDAPPQGRQRPQIKRRLKRLCTRCPGLVKSAGQR